MRVSLACACKTTMNYKDHLKQVFLAAVNAVQSSNLLRENIHVEGNQITIVNHKLYLTKPCYVVGFGKAVFGMASELLKILGENVHSGILSIPVGSLKQCKMALDANEEIKFNEKFKVYEGAKNNLPDEAAMETAKKIEAFCGNLKEDDVLIVLISGGGSALLPLPKDGVSLEKKQKLIKEMFNHGANINQVNAVRKQLSKLKGGGLARVAFPAQIYSLIISDVINDPLDIIASAPTVEDTQYQDISQILTMFDLFDSLDVNMKNALCEKHYKSDNNFFKNVHNYIIGNNTIACNAAKEKAKELGYLSEVISTTMAGDVHELAAFYEKLGFAIRNPHDLLHNLHKFQERLDKDTLGHIENHISQKKPVCLLFSGEPTIVVKSNDGVGGRNMHLALEVATKLNATKGLAFLSCGTDGFDGPTDVAGSIAPIGMSEEEMVMAKTYLQNTDSYHFFKEKKPEFLIKTGHTGTNVMDIHIFMFNV